MGLLIYMDVCCLNRPFDDLTQDRIYLEAEAVLTIVSQCVKGNWILVSSGVIDYELSKLEDMERLDKVMNLYSATRKRLRVTPLAEQRSIVLQQYGIKPFDSWHLALAETGNVNVFLTTDDRLLRSAEHLELKIKTANPVTWLMEELGYEKQ